MLKPLAAFWNKEYGEKGNNEYKKIFSRLIASVLQLNKINDASDLANHNFLFSDDLMVCFRNLGFLKDKDFERAFGPRHDDPILRARIWRIWVVSWSLSTRWTKGGLALDLGTYNGKTMFIAIKYAILKNQKLSNKRPSSIILADCFENPPSEASKKDHGKHLCDSVKNQFNQLDNVKVVKGFLPDSINNIDLSEGITWCQIDLNSAEADLNCLRYIYDKLNPGAIVVFDDYGFSRYSQTQNEIDKFLLDKPETVLEIPTGQGLMIKM